MAIVLGGLGFTLRPLLLTKWCCTLSVLPSFSSVFAWYPAPATALRLLLELLSFSPRSPRPWLCSQPAATDAARLAKPSVLPPLSTCCSCCRSARQTLGLAASLHLLQRMPLSSRNPRSCRLSPPAATDAAQLAEPPLLSSCCSCYPSASPWSPSPAVPPLL